MSASASESPRSAYTQGAYTSRIDPVNAAIMEAQNAIRSNQNSSQDIAAKISIVSELIKGVQSVQRTIENLKVNKHLKGDALIEKIEELNKKIQPEVDTIIQITGEIKSGEIRHHDLEGREFPPDSPKTRAVSITYEERKAWLSELLRVLAASGINKKNFKEQDINKSIRAIDETSSVQSIDALHEKIMNSLKKGNFKRGDIPIVINNIQKEKSQILTTIRNALLETSSSESTLLSREEAVQNLLKTQIKLKALSKAMFHHDRAKHFRKSIKEQLEHIDNLIAGIRQQNVDPNNFNTLYTDIQELIEGLVKDKITRKEAVLPLGARLTLSIDNATGVLGTQLLSTRMKDIKNTIEELKAANKISLIPLDKVIKALGECEKVLTQFIKDAAKINDGNVKKFETKLNNALAGIYIAYTKLPEIAKVAK
jgi:hypothetical protein